MSNRANFFCGAALAGSLIIFVGINLLTLKDGHNWGGDFAQYIIHARNLLDGSDYTDGIFISPDFFLTPVDHEYKPYPRYPPGFPGILAFAITFGGSGFIWLKSMNILFWMLWVLVLYGMIRRRVGVNAAFFSAIFLLSSPWLFTFKQSVMSDLPFVFFTTLAIAIYEKNTEAANPTSSRTRMAAFFLMAGLAMLCRSAGLALFLAAIFHLGLFKRNWWGAATTVAALGLLATLEWYVGASPSGYSDYFVYYLHGDYGIIGLFHAFAKHSFHTLIDAAMFFVPEVVYRAQPMLYKLILYLVILFVFLAIFILRCLTLGLFRKGAWLTRIEFIDLFLVIYLSMIAIYGAHPTRFILPVVGVLVIYLAEGAAYVIRRHNKPKLVRATAGLLVALALCHNFYFTMRRWNFDDDEIYRPAAQEMVTQVIQRIGPSEHYLFGKPRTLAFLSGRTGWFYGIDYYLPRKPELILPFCGKHGIDWVVLNRQWDEHEMGYLDTKKCFLKVWDNSQFALFRVVPPGQVR